MSADEDTLKSPLLPSSSFSSDDGKTSFSVDNGQLDTSSVRVSRNHVHGNGHHFPSLGPFSFIGIRKLHVPPSSTIDPFRNYTFFIEGLYEWMKIAVCLPIALVRVSFFGLCLLVGFLATKVALHGWRDRLNPMPSWRSRIMWITRISARCILFSFGYQWIKRKGSPAPRDVAPIIVSNHVSYIEPIFYFYDLFPTIVASESHDSIPFVGTIIRSMQVIYVDRYSPSSRRNAVNEIKRKASCNGFPRVLLFPEGTTTNGRVIISFQLGAFIPGYPVQPVVVRYPHVHFDQSWGHIGLTRLMFRMFTQFHNFMEVEYLPIVLPLQSTKESAVNFSDRTSRAIATALNVVQTSHSYGDLLLLNETGQLEKVHPFSFMVEMAMVEKILKVGTFEVLEFLQKFFSMNPDSSGRVKMNDFFKILKLRSCTFSQEIFDFIDVDSTRNITFKQFLFACVNVRNGGGFRSICERVVYECFGSSELISCEQIGKVFQYPTPQNCDSEACGMVVDVGGINGITKDEFRTFMNKNPLLIAFFGYHNTMVWKRGNGSTLP